MNVVGYEKILSVLAPPVSNPSYATANHYLFAAGTRAAAPRAWRALVSFWTECDKFSLDDKLLFSIYHVNWEAASRKFFFIDIHDIHGPRYSICYDILAAFHPLGFGCVV